MVAWSVELSEYDVQFEPRTTIKAQALANFLVDPTPPDGGLATPLPPSQPEPSVPQGAKTPTPSAHLAHECDSREFASRWLLKVNGSSGEAGSGAGVDLRCPDSSTHEHSTAFVFFASNNEAEYEALIAGLRAALAAKAEHLYILADAQLVVHQVNGKYAAKDVRMAAYLKMVKDLSAQFADFRIAQVPSAHNAWADALSKFGSTSCGNDLGPIYTDTLLHPSIAKLSKDVMQARQLPYFVGWIQLLNI